LVFLEVVFVIDRFDWVNWFARSAVDAFVWVDVHHACTLIDAVDGTFFDTGSVQNVDAGLCY